MFFIRTVLAKILGVNISKDIWSRLLRRMDHWTDGLIGALVEETCRTGKARNSRAGEISERDRKERLSTTYDRTIKDGHIQVAVRQAANRAIVRLMHVNSMDSKSAFIVLYFLRLKHPDLHEVDLDDPN